MIFLKVSSIIISILFLINGCSSVGFKVISQENHVTELSVAPSRILLECEYQSDNDTKGLYGFLIHTLDEENTVLTIVQNNTLDKEGCYERLKKIGKILKTGKSIYIGGMGEIREPRVKEERQYSFPGIGTFHDNGRSLQFIVIANELGACYDAYEGDKKPCPREPFSLRLK